MQILNLKIKTRLILQFLIIGILTIAVTTLLMWRIGVGTRSLQELHTSSLVAAQEMETNALKAIESSYQYIAFQHPKEKSRFFHFMNEFEKEFRTYERIEQSPGATSEFGEDRIIYDVSRLGILAKREGREIFADIDANQPFHRELDNFRKRTDRLGTQLARISEIEAQEVRDAQRATEDALVSSRNIAIGLGVLVFFLSLMFGYSSATSIADPIIELEEAAKKVASGDLNARVNLRSNDEIGELGQAFTLMQTNLSNYFGLLEDSKEKYQSLIDNIPDVAWIFDSSTGFEFISPNVDKVCGWAAEDMTRDFEKYFFNRIHPEDQQHVNKSREKLFEGLRYNVEYRFQKKNGEWIWLYDRSDQVMKVDGNQVAYGVFSDISDSKKTEEAISHMAYHDPLTNLPNRSLLSDRIEQEIARARREDKIFSLLYLDLSKFKQVNDELGHDIGDQTLKIVSQRINETLRYADTAARVGGDEFIILLQEIKKPEDASRVAKNILDNISKTIRLSTYEITLNACIGIAVYPASGLTPEALISAADLAMRRTKESGQTNCQCFFKEEMHVKAVERSTIEMELVRAVDNEELLLHYQPIVDVIEHRIIGAEALMRWNNPKKGLVYPKDFLNIAEETGLIVPMGEWAIKEVCRQSKKWVESGQILSVAANLSIKQFEQGNLAGMILETLKKAEIDPGKLAVELSEYTLMKNRIKAESALKQLTNKGVSVSIDDFGTEYFSLYYLKNFPIDTLKIAMPFIKDMIVDKSAAQIVKTIVNMANSLSLKIIAEGVETEEQLKSLAQLNVHTIQGFYFSKPLPAEDFESLLKKGKISRAA